MLGLLQRLRPLSRNEGFHNFLSRCSSKQEAYLQVPYHVTKMFSTKTNEGDDILVNVTNGVRTIRFNRPEKRNALTFDMLKTLITSVNEGSGDDKTSVIVLTGTGDYFTGGMDLSGPKKSGNDGTKPVDKLKVPEEVRKAKAAMFIHTFIDCKKPLIALVNGPAVGLGVTMLGLFDSVYASDKATFSTSFTRWGLPPEFCSTYTFPRMMGYARANRILLMDQKVTAQEAFEGGLVSRTFPHDTFPQETSRLVETYGMLPLKSLIYTKELLRNGRIKAILKSASDQEQSLFDPEVARNIKRQFLERQSKK